MVFSSVLNMKNTIPAAYWFIMTLRLLGHITFLIIISIASLRDIHAQKNPNPGINTHGPRSAGQYLYGLLKIT